MAHDASRHRDSTKTGSRVSPVTRTPPITDRPGRYAQIVSTTEPEPTVRPARPEEYAAVGAITVAAYDAAGMAHGEYVNQLRDAGRRAAEAELLVAVDAGGNVLGSVTFCPPGSSWREIARKDEGEFRMLAVHPNAQGKGVGRALVEACLRRCRVLGFRGLALSTPVTNGRAHQLYEQLGFRRDPARDWTPIPTVNLIVYERGLS